MENANYFTCNWTKEINYPLDVSKWALRRGEGREEEGGEEEGGEEEGGEEERDSKAKTQLRGELLRSTLLFARLLYNMEKKERERQSGCVSTNLFVLISTLCRTHS